MYYDLANAEHDVERPPGPSPVRRSYVLCSNPRSGSTLLSEALHATRHAGTPIEYFDGTDTMAACVQRWGCDDLPCYIACLHRYRTTADGLLGAKVHWYQLQELTMALGCDPRRGDLAGQRTALQRAFPEHRLIYVVRRDLDRQAVSWSIAEATGQWTVMHGAGRPDVAYDFTTIDDCRRRLEEAEAGWSALFAAAGVAPLTVTYEELIDDYPGTVARVAGDIGIDVAPDELPPPRLRRQADERNERFLRQYQRDRAGRADRARAPSPRGAGVFGDAHLSTAAMGGVPPGSAEP